MDKLPFSSDELQKITKQDYDDLKKAVFNLMVIADGTRGHLQRSLETICSYIELALIDLKQINEMNPGEFKNLIHQRQKEQN